MNQHAPRSVCEARRFIVCSAMGGCLISSFSGVLPTSHGSTILSPPIKRGRTGPSFLGIPMGRTIPRRCNCVEGGLTAPSSRETDVPHMLVDYLHVSGTLRTRINDHDYPSLYYIGTLSKSKIPRLIEGMYTRIVI